MTKKIFFLLLFISLSFKIYSQNQDVKGIVIDKNGQSLPGAGVTLLNPGDSAILAGTVTDTAGHFILNNVRQGKILLKISFLGFEDLFLDKEITSHPLFLGKIILNSKASTLKAVNITEKIPPVQQKGDTTQFNADAYKTNKDANAEDLVTKMPGVTTQDGKVQAQGEDVKKVLIDGKPFLGDDPNAALKNLPAEIIEKIQVFDKRSDQSEFTGFNDGNTTKTINIVTRPNFRNGTFGKLYAGYGTDELWKDGFNLNFFKDKRKFTVLGNMNNINEQNFSSDDLLGVLSSSTTNRPQGPRGPMPQRSGGGNNGGGGMGRYQSPSDVGNFLVDQRNGIITTYSAGMNYVNQWKKLDFALSYFFNHSENNVKSTLNRQYFTSDANGLIYNEGNSNNTKNTNQRANFRMEYKFDTLNSILFQPRISIQNNKGGSSVIGINSDSNGEISSAVSKSNNNLNGLSFSSPLLYRHAFSKRGRTITANFNVGYNQNKGDGDFNSVIKYDTDTLPPDTTDQVFDQHAHTWNKSTEITFTEPAGKTGQWSLNYRGTLINSESEKNTFSYSPSDNLYNSLDTLLSNNFESKYFTHSFGPSYRVQNDKWNLMVGAAYQRANLNNNTIFPYPGTLEKNFNSVLPTAMIQYKFSASKNIRMFFRSSNNSPTVTQLQDVVNNSNPLQLTAGNPDLKQDWQNNINIRYSAANPGKNTSFFLFLSGTLTNDYIGNSTIIAGSDTIVSDDIVLAAGSQLTRPVNINENYNLRSFANYSFPLSILKSTMNLNANLNYTHTPGLINNTVTYSNTTGSGLGFALSSNISDKIDFLLSSNGNYSNIINSFDKNSTNKSFNLSSRFKIQVMPWKGLVLQTDLNHQYNNGLSQNYNQNYLLWNAAIGYKFLKNQVAELRLSAFDLLKQNVSVTRNTSDTYYEDVRSNVLQQYFMLTFTYNVKLFKARGDR